MKFNLSLKKALAFTLAETLIVMGIIGVVAALTIPNLNSSTGEKEKIAKVKKVYSNLEDAVGRAQVVYGQIEEWETLDSSLIAQTTRFCERITEFMKVSKTCGMDKDKGCFSNTKIKQINGTETALSIDNAAGFYKFILADGTAVGILGDAIYIDIDGPNKGQNQFGTDLFLFNIDSETGTVIPVGPDNFSGYFSGVNSIMKTGSFAASWIINYDNMDYLKLDILGYCPNKFHPTEEKPRCK